MENRNLPPHQCSVLEHVSVHVIQRDRRVDILDVELGALTGVVVVKNQRVGGSMDDRPDTGKQMIFLYSDKSGL